MRRPWAFPVSLAILLVAAAWTPREIAAQTAAATDDTASAGSLYGMFIPMSDGSKTTTSTSPSFSSGVPSADFLRTLAGSDYNVQPGDVYALTLVYYGGSEGGTEALTLELFLEEDYTLALPLSGTVTARGKTLGELRKLAFARIRESVAVVHVDLWLKTPALFRVFVTGAVSKPGFVVANGLMRISDAVQGAGGIIQGASIRTIRLRRGGTERALDLLQFASGRDPSSNPRLMSGDAVYVPAAEKGAQVRGRVRFEGLYELVADETLADLLELAGGVSAGANQGSVTVTRIDSTGAYTVLPVNLNADAAFPIQDGDIVTVDSSAQNAPMVTVEGAVFGAPLDPAQPAAIPTSALSMQIPYSPGLTVLRLLEKMGGPTPAAEADKSFIVRLKGGAKVPFDAAALWQSRDPAADLPIEPGDHVVIPVKTLNVALRGEVLGPGIQAYVAGYTVTDYVRAAGGVTPTRGRIADLRVTSSAGQRKRVDASYEPAPGDTVVIGKQPLAAVGDFFGSYVFPVTGIVGGVLGVVTTIWNFVDRVQASQASP
jgi:protein involved in polysaccharide export with SLBB domain